MSMELKGNEEYIIHYYECKPEIETHPDLEDSKFDKEKLKYEDWLNRFINYKYKLVNVVRHPDMSRNILIHYFTTKPFGDIPSLSEIEVS